MKKRGLLILAAATLLFSCSQPAESSSLPSSEESSVAPSASNSGEKSGFVDATKELVLVYKEDLEDYPFPGYFVADYKGKEPKILIPDEATVDGRTAPILGVEKYAFSKRAGIEAIAFGKNVSYLGEGAFLDSGVKRIYATPSLVRIHKDAFLQSQIEFYRNASGILCIPSFENEECVAISARHFSLSDGNSLGNVETIADHAFDEAFYFPPLSDRVVAIGDVERKDGQRFNLGNRTDGLVHVGANALQGEGALMLGGKRTFVGESFYKCVTEEPQIGFLGEENYLSVGAFSSISSRDSTPVHLSFDPAHWFDTRGKEALGDVDVDVSFPESVESPFGAMKTRFEVPDSVAELDAYEFAKCKGLTHVHLPQPLPLGDYAFYECENLEVFEADGDRDKAISIGTRAFGGCKNLLSLSFAVNKIGEAPFEGCSSLSSLSITGLRINGPTFKKDLFGSSGLSSLSLATIDCDFDGAVDYSWLTKLIAFPELREPLGSLQGCSSITDLTIPEGVTELPSYFCRDCVSLKAVKLPSTLKKIGNSAFQGCTSLEEIEIPEGVESIGSAAFESSGLKQIAIPPKVKTLPERSLSSASLQQVFLPIGLEKVDRNAFRDCPSTLKVGIRYSTTEELFASRDYYSNLSYFDKSFLMPDGKALIDLEIPSSVKSISPYQFYRCRDLKSVNFSEGIEEIGAFAFDYCSGLAGKIVLPDTLKSASFLFGNCPSDIEVSVPSTVEALSNCQKISIRMVSPESLLSHSTASWKGISSWKLTDQGGNEITSLAIPSTVMDIWASMEEKPYGLNQCANLTEIFLPEGMTSVPDYLFSHCSSLETIHFPSTLTTIGEHSFEFCSKLTSIALPDSLAEIKQRGFYSCQKLETVQFGKGLREIGAYAFAYAYALKSIALPSLLETIGDYAFYRSLHLENVSFPSSLVSIGQYAFSKTYLGEIYVPVSVTSIGKGAFTEILSNGFICSCGAASKPDGWDSDWIWSGAQITWGVPEP